MQCGLSGNRVAENGNAPTRLSTETAIRRQMVAKGEIQPDLSRKIYSICCHRSYGKLCVGRDALIAPTLPLRSFWSAPSGTLWCFMIRRLCFMIRLLLLLTAARCGHRALRRGRERLQAEDRSHRADPCCCGAELLIRAGGRTKFSRATYSVSGGFFCGKRRQPSK